jgi:zinc transport system permease protein
MEGLIELMNYNFFIRALLAVFLASISCGIAGTYIVSRRIVFISGGITHASFGGIGIGYFLGLNPVLGAMVFGVASALGLTYLSEKANIREDSAIAIFWSLGMAIGIIFIYLTPGYTPNLMSYLFGSVLAITTAELYLMAGLVILLATFFIIFYRHILSISFDEEFARAYGAPVGLIKYSLLSLVALTIVLNIRVSGVILVISLLTIPQTIANIFTKKFSRIIYIAIPAGLVGTIGGLIFSYYTNIPSGASIIFTLALMYVCVKSVSVLRNSVARKNL